MKLSDLKESLEEAFGDAYETVCIFLEEYDREDPESVGRYDGAQAVFSIIMNIPGMQEYYDELVEDEMVSNLESLSKKVSL